MTPDRLRRMGIYLQYFGFLLCRWAGEMTERREPGKQEKQGRGRPGRGKG